MTKHQTTNLQTDWRLGDMPDFDPIAMKNKIQAEILQDTEGMTDEEVREFFRLACERDALRRKALARRQAAEAQT